MLLSKIVDLVNAKSFGETSYTYSDILPYFLDAVESINSEVDSHRAIALPPAISESDAGYVIASYRGVSDNHISTYIVTAITVAMDSAALAVTTRTQTYAAQLNIYKRNLISELYKWMPITSDPNVYYDMSSGYAPATNPMYDFWLNDSPKASRKTPEVGNVWYDESEGGRLSYNASTSGAYHTVPAYSVYCDNPYGTLRPYKPGERIRPGVNTYKYIFTPTPYFSMYYTEVVVNVTITGYNAPYEAPKYIKPIVTLSSKYDDFDKLIEAAWNSLLDSNGAPLTGSLGSVNTWFLDRSTNTAHSYTFSVQGKSLTYFNPTTLERGVITRNADRFEVSTDHLISEVELPRLLGPTGASLDLDYANGIIKLLDKDSNVLSQVDLPTEKIITDVYYDTDAKEIVIEFENSQTVAMPLNDMINANVDINIKNLSVAGKVKTQLVPNEDNKFNLGSSVKGWKNLYVDKIYYQIGTKTDAYGSKVPVFSNNAVNVEAYGDKATQVELRIKNHDGYEETVFNAVPDDYTSLKFNGNEFLKGYSYGITMRNPGNNKMIFNSDFGEDDGGGINIGNDQLDIVHTRKLNIIPDFKYTDNGDDLSIYDRHQYHRLKIGGKEYVTEEDANSYNLTPVIFAYKQPNSDGLVPPFVITKEGKVYYQGKEIGGNNTEFDKIKVSRITDNAAYSGMATIELEGGSRKGYITLDAGGNEGSASISLSGSTSSGSGNIDLNGFTSVSGALSVNGKRALTVDDLGDIETAVAKGDDLYHISLDYENNNQRLFCDWYSSVELTDSEKIFETCSQYDYIPAGGTVVTSDGQIVDVISISPFPSGFDVWYKDSDGNVTDASVDVDLNAVCFSCTKIATGVSTSSLYMHSVKMNGDNGCVHVTLYNTTATPITTFDTLYNSLEPNVYYQANGGMFDNSKSWHVVSVYADEDTIYFNTIDDNEFCEGGNDNGDLQNLIITDDVVPIGSVSLAPAESPTDVLFEGHMTFYDNKDGLNSNPETLNNAKTLFNIFKNPEYKAFLININQAMISETGQNCGLITGMDDGGCYIPISDIYTSVINDNDIVWARFYSGDNYFSIDFYGKELETSFTYDNDTNRIRFSGDELQCNITITKIIGIK